MAARKTFDSSTYHEARENFDGYCLGCGKKIGFTKALFLTKSGDLRQSVPPISLMVCDHQCKRLFIEKSIRDWSKIRDQVIARDGFTCQDCHRSYNIKFRKVRRPIGRMPSLSDVERDPKGAEKKFEDFKFKTVWKLDREPLALEVHHIVPISEGGDEWDPENLVTLCFDCHHLGRHGSKAPTPEEIAEKRGEERRRAEQERLAAIRTRHTCLDCFSEVA
jgi:5-methylcytosine-specific restriction endonuclease McrA